MKICLGASGESTPRPYGRLTRWPLHDIAIYQYCMVYGIQKGGRWGGRILCNGRATVLIAVARAMQVEGAIKGCLICAQKPRSKTISCKGQLTRRPAAPRVPLGPPPHSQWRAEYPTLPYSQRRAKYLALPYSQRRAKYLVLP